MQHALNSRPGVLRMSEKDRALAYCDRYRYLRSVLSCPWVNVPQKQFMGLQDVLVGKPFNRGQIEVLR